MTWLKHSLTWERVHFLLRRVSSILPYRFSIVFPSDLWKPRWRVTSSSFCVGWFYTTRLRWWGRLCFNRTSQLPAVATTRNRFKATAKAFIKFKFQFAFLPHASDWATSPPTSVWFHRFVPAHARILSLHHPDIARIIVDESLSYCLSFLELAFIKNAMHHRTCFLTYR